MVDCMIVGEEYRKVQEMRLFQLLEVVRHAIEEVNCTSTEAAQNDIRNVLLRLTFLALSNF